MKLALLLSVAAGIMLLACSDMGGGNPFFSAYNTPFEVPPFEKIKEEHFMPAFVEGMKQEMEEVTAIINNSDAPTFENTIEALDRTGELLSKVSATFGALSGAHTNDQLQQIARDVSPLRSKHRDDIMLNEKLFERVKAVYEQRANLDLNEEQAKLLDDTYKAFERGGANLSEADKEILRGINSELSLLTIKFGENILKEDNAFTLVIDNEDDLSGLPEAVIAGAKEAAEAREETGKWVFTLHKPSLIPFLQYSDKRDLREKMFTAYMMRGNNGNELDNKENLAKIAALRVNRAKLMGYDTHAHFVLERNMAKVPQNVYDLLNQLWKPAINVAKKEVYDMQAIVDQEGGSFRIKPWDWWYYAEKVRKAKFDLDESELRPYFKLENVREGAFYVANQLWGITFEKRTDIPVYHPEVETFEVKDADGTHLGIFLTDYFPRSSKRGGAWMSSFRSQEIKDGVNIRPVIYNVGNFSKPAGDKPALLSFDETLTLFHEFGHMLHGMLSQCTYSSLSGTSVPRDFVELPSQIMENWAAEPEVMKIYAKHYETGEPIPQRLIDKLKNSSTFNQGFITVEYLAASFLDMDWHTLTEAEEHESHAFEDASMEKIGLIQEIIPRYKSHYFNHIFAGGYSSGYYSYIWAEVLDKDAFQAFKETSLFDQNTARLYRDNILAKGGTGDPMEMYVRFRGAEPKIDALLEGRGLK